MHTQEFEHLLDLDNVTGIEYDADRDRVIAFVTKKIPEDELDDDQVIQRNVDRDTDVEELGEISVEPTRMEDLADAQGDRQSKHRPIPAGVSEINASGTAATGGPYPVKVVDTTKGEWGPTVEEGDIVRLSNNHVYARENEATFDEQISQPSPYDGGSPADAVGTLAGYVPLQDDVTVDLAARTVNPERESMKYHELSDRYPTGIKRDNWSALKDEEVIKTGRTTGVTRGTVKATSATIKVGYGDGNAITLRDQIVTGDMSEGGDSGSPVFHIESGELIGESFAGSDRSSIVYKASNMEAEFGVKLMTEEPETDSPTYQTSLKTTVSITMEDPNLDLEQLSGDKPTAGETIDATVTLSGNQPGTVWVEAQDHRYTTEFTADHKSDGSYQRDVAVSITAPETYVGSFDLDLTGGYVLDS